jgi:hypothetical protein
LSFKVIIFLTFLATFAKLERAASSFIMSVRKEQLDFQWVDFYESIFQRVPYMKTCVHL